MGWKDLLQKPNETVVSYWAGGRSLRSFDRTWSIEGRLPPEHGWHEFRLNGRRVQWAQASDPNFESLRDSFVGYLIGNRIIPDTATAIDPDVRKIAEQSCEVFQLPDGLDRFARVRVGRPFENGPLVFMEFAFPLGPEEEVLTAYLDARDSVSHVKGVAPALDAAFRLENYQRAEAKRRREELERIRLAEEERRAAEERRQKIAEQLGTAIGRRALAEVDFDEAARAALSIGGATFLDARRGTERGEMIVRFRYANRRFECTCDKKTMQIIESGICLVDHRTGIAGDTFFTLESLPGVIREAIDNHKLVIFRHAYA